MPIQLTENNNQNNVNLIRPWKKRPNAFLHPQLKSAA